jgi:hypothetical protein
MLTGTDQPPIASDYQTSIDALCDVIANDEPNEAALDVFFKDHPKLYDVDGRNSIHKMRPLQIAALFGSHRSFRYLIEKRNASLATERIPNGKGKYILEMNIIEYAGQEAVNQDRRNYIWNNRLWKKFNDPDFLEVYALAWCGQIVRAVDLLTESNLSEKELHKLLVYTNELREPSNNDQSLLEQIDKLKSKRKRPRLTIEPLNLYDFAEGSESEKDDVLSNADDSTQEIDEDTKAEKELSRLQKNTDAFCQLASDEDKDHTHLANFISTLTIENFNIDARHTETKARAVECAADTGSFASFKYLIEELKADVAYDSDQPVANLMDLISPMEDDKASLFIKNKLWERLNDGTTELHAYAWAGDFEKVQQLVYQNAHAIFDVNNEGDGALEWAHYSTNKSILPFLFGILDEMIGEGIIKHFYDNLRDIWAFKAKFHSRIDATQDAIEAYFQALHYHRHATIDFSRATEDTLLRALSKQFCAHSLTLLRPLAARLEIKVADKLEKTLLKYDENMYTMDVLAALYDKGIIHMKEAMRSIHVLETKTPADIAEYILFRYNAVIQSNNFAQVYKEIGRHLHLNKLYAEALGAFQLGIKCVNAGLMIATHAQNKDYYFYYGPDSPPPDPELITKAQTELRMFLSKIELCERMAMNVAHSSTNQVFSIFKKPETLSATRPSHASCSSSGSLVIRH